MKSGAARALLVGASGFFIAQQGQLPNQSEKPFPQTQIPKATTRR